MGLIKYRYTSLTSFQTLSLVYFIVAYKSCHDFTTTAVGFMQVKLCKIIWKRAMIFWKASYREKFLHRAVVWHNVQAQLEPLWWTGVSLSFQQVFDKMLHRVIDLKVQHNDRTSKFPGFCLSSGFNMQECWETVSNKMHNSVGNTAWETRNSKQSM